MSSHTLNGCEVYHGAETWNGFGTLSATNRPGRCVLPDVMEYGPGIYFSTRIATAQQYAGACGVIIQAVISPSARLLNSSMIPLEFARACLDQFAPAAANRILSELRSMSRGLAVRTEFLVNMLIGDHVKYDDKPCSIDLARWIVKHGSDVLIVPQARGEQWIVVFNPEVIQEEHLHSVPYL